MRTATCIQRLQTAERKLRDVVSARPLANHRAGLVRKLLSTRRVFAHFAHMLSAAKCAKATAAYSDRHPVLTVELLLCASPRSVRSGRDMWLHIESFEFEPSFTLAQMQTIKPVQREPQVFIGHTLRQLSIAGWLITDTVGRDIATN